MTVRLDEVVIARVYWEKNENSCVLAIDRDEQAIFNGENLAKKHPKRFDIKWEKFSNLQNLITTDKLTNKFKNLEIAGVVMDLGVSSPQLKEGTRGFSFQVDGPLDMRMGFNEFSAYSLVNEAKEQKLADIIYIYGDEYHARKIARNIVKTRAKAPIRTTKELTYIVHQAIGCEKIGTINSATKTFQALRIAVNDELYELQEGLKCALSILSKGGRLVVVTFHSGEDRIVKKFLQEHTKIVDEVILHKVTKEEIQRNPRARSAKLRGCTKIKKFNIDVETRVNGK